MSKSELVTNLVAEDGTPVHHVIPLSVRILNAIPSWVIATEGEAGNTLGEAGPAEAESPSRTWIEILVSYELHCVRVLRAVADEGVEDSLGAACLVLGAPKGLPGLDLRLKEVIRDLAWIGFHGILSWNDSAFLQNFYGFYSKEEG